MPEEVRRGLFGIVARLADRTAWAMADIGQLGRAHKIYDFALSVTPDDAQRWLTIVNVADLRLRQDEPESALRLLDRTEPGVPVLRFLVNAARAHAQARFGRYSATLRHIEYVGALVIQLGNALGSLGRTLPLVGNRNRWRSAIGQMLAVGVDAFPMVGVMAVCAGFILAMQGASELRRFGAMEFVVDLVTIGFTRELGPLLTAIAVSGRSGSAFSAEIGSMVISMTGGIS